MAKFKYVPELPKKKTGNHYDVKDSLYMIKCADIMKREVVLPLPLVCRNLWNFYALEFYDSELFDKFGKIIVKNYKDLNELDVANAMKAFAYFKHMNYECMESLIKITIQNCQDYKMKTLAVIANSLAELDIKNKTVFNIIKTTILRQHLKGADSHEVDVEAINPIDCA